MKFLALALILAITGCASDEELSGQPAQATAQIQTWVPIGTPLADARRIMEDRQFTCWVMTSGNVGDAKAAQILYCDRTAASSEPGPVVTHRWQVVLTFKDGKVLTVHVTTTMLGR